MGVFVFIQRLVEHAAEINNENFDSVKSNIVAFLEAIEDDKEEIRIFVAGSVNLGHQSTSIIIMDRLISLGVTRIRIVYEQRIEQNKKLDKETSHKLTILIAGLKEDDIERGYFTFFHQETGKEVIIFFSKYEKFEEKNDSVLVTLGIAGGFDGTKNITTKLKVRTLLVLQPYRYQKQSAVNIIYFMNSKKEIRLPADFVERGFYIKDPERPVDIKPVVIAKKLIGEDFEILKNFKNLWAEENYIVETLSQIVVGKLQDDDFLQALGKYRFDEDDRDEIETELKGKEIEVNDAAIWKYVAEQQVELYSMAVMKAVKKFPGIGDQWQGETVKTIETQLGNKSIKMCPIYFSQGRTESQPPTVLFNLLTGLFAANDSGQEKPIVMMVIADFFPAVYDTLTKIMSREIAYWIKPPDADAVDYESQKKEYEKRLERQVNQMKDVMAVREWVPDFSENIFDYIDKKKYFDRFEKVKIIHKNEDLSEAIDDVGKQGIVIVDLKRVERPVFNYLYYIATLPGMFEGEATASLILNIGKPYFNLQSYEKGENGDLQLYPDLTKEHKEIPGNLGDAHFWFSNASWQDSSSDKIIELDAKIGAFIDNAYDKNSNLKKYFDSLREFFHSEQQDKFLTGLFIALLEMKKNKIFKSEE